MCMGQLSDHMTQVFDFDGLWQDVVAGNGHLVRVIGLQSLDEAGVSGDREQAHEGEAGIQVKTYKWYVSSGSGSSRK